jgi:thiamine pyrophosphate-dependent acetolactate synthase large subunit-like protein
MKAAQYWGDYLKARGVSRISGLPGTESLEVVEATRLAGLDFFLTRHEATTGFISPGPAT